MGSESGTLWTDQSLLTPTGAPFQHAIDNQYVTKEDFIGHPLVADGLGLKATDSYYTNGYVDKLLQRASTWVNRYCHRHFDKQTIDEQYPYTNINKNYLAQLTVILKEAPVVKVNSIYFQTLSYFTKFDLSYLQVNPDAGSYKVSPLLTNTAGVNVPAPALQNPAATIIWTNYTFGYDSIPSDVTEAVIMLAARFYANQRNVIGATDFKTSTMTMSWDWEKDPVMLQIKDMLKPYKKMLILPC